MAPHQIKPFDLMQGIELVYIYTRGLVVSVMRQL